MKEERKPITGIIGFVMELNSKDVIHHGDGSEIREGALKVRFLDHFARPVVRITSL